MLENEYLKIQEQGKYDWYCDITSGCTYLCREHISEQTGYLHEE